MIAYACFWLFSCCWSLSKRFCCCSCVLDYAVVALLFYGRCMIVILLFDLLFMLVYSLSIFCSQFSKWYATVTGCFWLLQVVYDSLQVVHGCHRFDCYLCLLVLLVDWLFVVWILVWNRSLLLVVVVLSILVLVPVLVAFGAGDDGIVLAVVVCHCYCFLRFSLFFYCYGYGYCYCCCCCCCLLFV